MFKNYDAEKQFLLDKKLTNHINAKNNPHHVSASDIGLSLVENRGFKNKWEFEEGEPDTYMSSLTIKEQIDRINESIQDLESVEKINQFLEFQSSPLLVNIEAGNMWFEPTPGSTKWNKLLEFIETSRYFHLTVNGTYTYFALATKARDDENHTSSLILRCAENGTIIINYKEDTEEVDYNLTGWLGNENTRTLGIEIFELEEQSLTEANPEEESVLEDPPSLFFDNVIFPAWLDNEDRGARLNVFPAYEQALPINVIFKKGTKFTYEKALVCSSLPRQPELLLFSGLRGAPIQNTLYIFCSKACYELKFARDSEDESGEWQLISFKEL